MSCDPITNLGGGSKSNISFLASLGVSAGNLTPEFSKSVLSYSVEDNALTSLTIDGVAVPDLQPDTFYYEMDVTNGETSQPYGITILREDPTE